MYVEGNPKTKKQLKGWVADGRKVGVFQPGFGEPARPGETVSVEGPHYPRPHTWYARVILDADGYISKVK